MKCSHGFLLSCISLLIATSTVYSAGNNYLPGQIILDPEHPHKMVYNRDSNNDGKLDPAFLCGPGGPEGFLFGDISGGNSPGDVLDAMIKHGGNCMYIQGIRSHGGDGDETHNPFIDHDPSKGIDKGVFNQWEKWFQRMEENNIIIYFYLFDDSTKIGPKDKIGEHEKTYIQAIVNRFEHHPNLIWIIAEEYSETHSKEKISQIAQLIRKEDDHDHIIGNHQLPNLSFHHKNDPHIDQYAMQLKSTGPFSDIHKKCLTALDNADKEYSLVLAEQYDWHSTLLEEGDRDGVRKINWASAMTGTPILHLGTWETTRERRPPSKGMLNDYRHVYSLLESQPDLNEMQSLDSLIETGQAWVLGKKNHYIVYVLEGGKFTIDLRDTSNELKARWYNPQNGKYKKAFDCDGGSVETFTAPNNKDWVLHIQTK